jgi:hypothetical protein
MEKNYDMFKDEKVKVNNEKKLPALNAELEEELKKVRDEIAIL